MSGVIIGCTNVNLKYENESSIDTHFELIKSIWVKFEK